MNKYACLTFAVASFAAGTVFADLNSPAAEWTKAYSEPVWWFAEPTNWKTYSQYQNNVVREGTSPEPGDMALIGDYSTGGTTIYLKDGDVVTNLLGLSVCHGHSCTKQVTLEIRKGAFVSETASGSSNKAYEHTLIGGDAGKTNGKILVDGGTLVSSRIWVGGGTRVQSGYPGEGYLEVVNSAVVTNNTSLEVGRNGAKGRVDVVSSWAQLAGWTASVGANGDAYVNEAVLTASNSTLVAGNVFSVKGTGRVDVQGTSILMKSTDWSANAPAMTIDGNSSQTNYVHLKDSVLKIYDTDWNSSSEQWARWRKLTFKSQGYSEFIQENSTVTNVGVWFWPTENAGNVYPVKPPRYVVKGGELYVYSRNNNGDAQNGYPDGAATCGFAAATNAPNSGTVSLVDAPKVSYPRVCTDILISGQGQQSSARVFGHTDYRPHFEFVLTKKGHRPMEIREQTDVYGMYSFVPQGGLQVVQTNRFALIRHKTASSVMATADEPQFRAPNTDLWTTGGFSDMTCEWGVALKSESEIAVGEELGQGVASGYVKLPRCNPRMLRKCLMRLKMVPAAKTLAEVAADLEAAGYPATTEGSNEVVVDLMASGMLAKGSPNNVLFDFNEPQDAVGVRDGVKTANARVLKVTVDFVGPGLILIFR